MPDLPTLFLLYIVVTFLLIATGIILAIKFFDLRKETAIAVSCGISTLIVGYSAFASFLTGIPLLFFFLALLILAGVISCVYWKRGFREAVLELLCGKAGFMLTVWFLGSFELFLFQTTIPCYSGAGYWGDWWMHFDLTQVYLHLREITIRYFGATTVASRTPLLNWAGAYFQGLFFNEFYTFQITVTAIGSAVFPAAYLLADKVVGGKAAKTFVFILMANPFLIYNTAYTWPKTLAAYSLLVMIYFMTRIIAKEAENREFILLGIFAAAAYLAHPSAMFEVFGTCLFILLVLEKKLRLSKPVMAFVVFILIITPWLLWCVNEFGLKGVLRASPIFTYRYINRGVSWLGSKIDTALTQFYPYNLNMSGGLSGNILEGGKLDGILRYYRSVLPGTITTAFALLLLIYAVYVMIRFILHRFKKGIPVAERIPSGQGSGEGSGAGNRRDILLYLTGLPLFVFTALVLTFPHRHTGGLAGEALTATVIIISMFAVAILHKLWKPARIIFASLFVLESIFAFSLQFCSQSLRDANFVLKNDYKLIFLYDVFIDSGITPRILVTAFIVYIFLVVYACIYRTLWDNPKEKTLPAQTGGE